MTPSGALPVSNSIKPRDRRRRDKSLRRTRRSHRDGSLSRQIGQVGRHQRWGNKRHRIDSRYWRGKHRRRTWNFCGVASWGWRGWHNLTVCVCVMSVRVGMSMVVMTANWVLLRKWGRFTRASHLSCLVVGAHRLLHWL